MDFGRSARTIWQYSFFPSFFFLFLSPQTFITLIESSINWEWLAIEFDTNHQPYTSGKLPASLRSLVAVACMRQMQAYAQNYRCAWEQITDTLCRWRASNPYIDLSPHLVGTSTNHQKLVERSFRVSGYHTWFITRRLLSVCCRPDMRMWLCTIELQLQF